MSPSSWRIETTGRSTTVPAKCTVPATGASTVLPPPTATSIPRWPAEYRVGGASNGRIVGCGAAIGHAQRASGAHSAPSSGIASGSRSTAGRCAAVALPGKSTNAAARPTAQNPDRLRRRLAAGKGLTGPDRRSARAPERGAGSAARSDILRPCHRSASRGGCSADRWRVDLAAALCRASLWRIPRGGRLTRRGGEGMLL